MALNSISFDEQYYLQQNPDVASAVSKGLFASGEAHFNAFGRFEQRDPNQFFDTSFYLGQYPDVAASKLNPFQHFLSFGAKEGRFFNANELATIDTDNNGAANEFNVTAYLTANPDVDAAIKSGALSSAYQHFVLFGQFEGRTATLNNGTVVSGPLANGGTGGGTNTGTTFTLTTNTDGPGAAAPAANTTGTAGNDTFSATDNALTTADSINGGAGTDTLSVRVTAAGQSVTPLLNSVENIVVNNISNGTYIFNATSSTGASNFVSKDSTALSSTIFSNVAATSTLTLDNADGLTSFNLSGASARTGTTDVLTLNVANGTGSATTAARVQFVDDANAAYDSTFETLNVNTTGAASVLNIVGGVANVKAINVAGAGSLSLSEAAGFANVETVDASKLTGTAGLEIALTGNTKAVTVTGSAGADKFVFGTTLGAGDSVVGGAGVDTVTIEGSDLTVAANAQLTALNTKVTGVEVLEFNGANAATIAGGTGTGAFTNTEITKLLFNTADAGTDTINEAGSARTYAFGESNSGAAVLNGAFGVTTFNVSLEGIANNGGGLNGLAGNFTNSSATQVGTGTFNIASIGSNEGSSANETGIISGQSNGGTLTSTSVVITGSHDLTVAGLNSAGTINASAFTGKLVVAGSAGQDVITGGAGNDIINATAGADTYTGGAGKDTFVFTDKGQGLATSLTTVTDFISGTDKIDVSGLSNGAGTFNATAVNVTSAPDFTSALNLAAAGDGTVGATTYFQQGGNTYVVVDNGPGATFDAATDAVIKITGLVTLTATDVVA